MSNKIENAFTIQHLRIAKMIALGYSVKEIAKNMHYSKQMIYRKIWDLYLRYEISDKNPALRKKGLFELLHSKYIA